MFRDHLSLASIFSVLRRPIKQDPLTCHELGCSDQGIVQNAQSMRLVLCKLVLEKAFTVHFTARVLPCSSSNMAVSTDS